MGLGSGSYSTVGPSVYRDCPKFYSIIFLVEMGTKDLTSHEDMV